MRFLSFFFFFLIFFYANTLKQILFAFLLFSDIELITLVYETLWAYHGLFASNQSSGVFCLSVPFPAGLNADRPTQIPDMHNSDSSNDESAPSCRWRDVFFMMWPNVYDCMPL